MKASLSPPLIKLPIQTAAGVFFAAYSGHGLARLTFPPTASQPVACNFVIPAPKMAKWHRLTTRAVWLTLQGRPVKELPPLDLSAGTTFQQQVWLALLAIPCGQTRTYAQLAQALGKPNAARAVGQACAANPIPLLIPCHRVVAHHGQLGGFSAGLLWKKRLLAAEKSRQPAM